MRWLGASNRDAIASHDGRSPSVFEPEPDGRPHSLRSLWALRLTGFKSSSTLRLTDYEHTLRGARWNCSS